MAESSPHALSQFSELSFHEYIRNFFSSQSPQKHRFLFASIYVSEEVCRYSHYVKAFQNAQCCYEYYNISLHSCCYTVHGKFPMLLFLSNFPSLTKHSQDISRNVAWSRDFLATSQPSLLTQREAFHTERQALLTQMQDVACCPVSGFIKHSMLPESESVLPSRGLSY